MFSLLMTTLYNLVLAPPECVTIAQEWRTRIDIHILMNKARGIIMDAGSFNDDKDLMRVYSGLKLIGDKLHTNTITNGELPSDDQTEFTMQEELCDVVRCGVVWCGVECNGVL